MSRYSRWAHTERSLAVRLAASLAAGFVFVILLPLLIATAGPALDELLGLPGFKTGALNIVLGGLLVAAGLSLGFWTGYVQLTRGRGTPLPILPTQELLTRGPFRYCRNPMTLGTILAYLGIAVCAGTVAGIGLVIGFAALLLFYLKRMEEKELAERFGAAYLQYKRDVPFLIPRLPKS